VNEYHIRSLCEIVDRRPKERTRLNNPQRFNKGERSEQVATNALILRILGEEIARNGCPRSNVAHRTVSAAEKMWRVYETRTYDDDMLLPHASIEGT
jgi:hypothetical protein